MDWCACYTSALSIMKSETKSKSAKLSSCNLYSIKSDHYGAKEVADTFYNIYLYLKHLRVSSSGNPLHRNRATSHSHSQQSTPSVLLCERSLQAPISRIAMASDPPLSTSHRLPQETDHQTRRRRRKRRRRRRSCIRQIRIC